VDSQDEDKKKCLL